MSSLRAGRSLVFSALGSGSSGASGAGGYQGFRGGSFSRDGPGGFFLVLAPDLVREPGEDHDDAAPLLARQRVAVPDGGDEDAHELARGGDGGVGERAEAADGEEDEVLAHGPAQAEEQDVPRRLRVPRAEPHRVVPAPARHREHEQRHVRRAPQVHPHHQVPRVHLRVPRRQRILRRVREPVQPQVEQTQRVPQRRVRTRDLARRPRALQNSMIQISSVKL